MQKQNIIIKLLIIKIYIYKAIAINNTLNNIILNKFVNTLNNFTNNSNYINLQVGIIIANIYKANIYIEIKS